MILAASGDSEEDDPFLEAARITSFNPNVLSREFLQVAPRRPPQLKKVLRKPPNTYTFANVEKHLRERQSSELHRVTVILLLSVCVGPRQKRTEVGVFYVK